MEAADLFLTLTTSLHITSLAAQILDTDVLARPQRVVALVEQMLGNERGLLTPCIFCASAVSRMRMSRPGMYHSSQIKLWMLLQQR